LILSVVVAWDTLLFIFVRLFSWVLLLVLVLSNRNKERPECDWLVDAELFIGKMFSFEI